MEQLAWVVKTHCPSGSQQAPSAGCGQGFGVQEPSTKTPPSAVQFDDGSNMQAPLAKQQAPLGVCDQQGVYPAMTKPIEPSHSIGTTCGGV